jgi:hypothetical protein
MEEWKATKDFSWVKQVGLSSFTSKIGMFVTRGLLKSSYAIGMKGHLIPRCGDKSSPCFKKPYQGFFDSKMGQP